MFFYGVLFFFSLACLLVVMGIWPGALYISRQVLLPLRYIAQALFLLFETEFHKVAQTEFELTLDTRKASNLGIPCLLFEQLGPLRANWYSLWALKLMLRMLTSVSLFFLMYANEAFKATFHKSGYVIFLLLSTSKHLLITTGYLLWPMIA